MLEAICRNFWSEAPVCIVYTLLYCVLDPKLPAFAKPRKNWVDFPAARWSLQLLQAKHSICIICYCQLALAPLALIYKTIKTSPLPRTLTLFATQKTVHRYTKCVFNLHWWQGGLGKKIKYFGDIFPREIESKKHHGYFFAVWKLLLVHEFLYPHNHQKRIFYLFI